MRGTVSNPPQAFSIPGSMVYQSDYPLCPNEDTGILQPDRRACQHFVLASTVALPSVTKRCMVSVNHECGYICHVECNLPFDVSYKIKCAGCLYQVRTIYSCVNQTAVIERKLCRNKKLSLCLCLG